LLNLILTSLYIGRLDYWQKRVQTWWLICSFARDKVDHNSSHLWNKIVSALSIKSLNAYADFYQRIQTIAILWHKQNARLLNVSEKKRLIKWAKNTCLATVINKGCCAYLLIKEFISPQRLYPLEFLFIQLSLIMFAAFWSVVFIAANLFGKDFVCAWNQMIKTLLNVRKHFGDNKLIQSNSV